MWLADKNISALIILIIFLCIDILLHHKHFYPDFFHLFNNKNPKDMNVFICYHWSKCIVYGKSICQKTQMCFFQSWTIGPNISVRQLWPGINNITLISNDPRLDYCPKRTAWRDCITRWACGGRRLPLWISDEIFLRHWSRHKDGPDLVTALEDLEGVKTGQAYNVWIWQEVP